ncbi:Conserved oligomeric Golgi complex subunit 8 [Spathaspora sp. JA1]|nr:Conserved oligomeric Golgi complex subunit 8 [Spathaspora sp. JA1]
MSILLDTLKSGLDPQYQQLLDSNPELSTKSQEFLERLLINDDLLSTDTFMASSVNTTNDNSPTSRKTLIEEIAELDSTHRAINLKLSQITDSNRDLIIDINNDLHTVVHDQLLDSYPAKLDSISKLLESDVLVHTHTTSSINTLVLDKIDSILDILELPTLCKICILQGNYQEALEISMLIQTLIIRFPKLLIFTQIHQQIELELKSMVKGLLKLLTTDLKQNNIIKIFQILNKLDLLTGTNNLIVNDETNEKTKLLKIIYLNSRYKFITNQVNSLDPLIKFNKLTYLKRFIETYREYIFNSLSIFTTIFKQQQDENNLLINQFIQSLTELLIQQLHTHLKDIDQNQVNGIILQIIYLCKSLAGFSMDFESMIVYELCFKLKLIGEEDWNGNLKKVKHRHY